VEAHPVIWLVQGAMAADCGPAEPETVEYLACVLKTGAPAERGQAAVRSGYQERVAVKDSLLAALGDEGWHAGVDGWHPVGRYAAEALLMYGTEELTAAVRSPSRAVRRQAVWALTVDVPHEEAQEPAIRLALLSASRDVDPRVRELAAGVAEPALLRRQLALLNDPSPTVRSAAQAALSRTAHRWDVAEPDRVRIKEALGIVDRELPDTCEDKPDPVACRLAHPQAAVRLAGIEAAGEAHVGALAGLLGDLAEATVSEGCVVGTQTLGNWASERLQELGAASLGALVEAQGPEAARALAWVLGEGEGDPALRERALVRLVSLARSEDAALQVAALSQPVPDPRLVEVVLERLRSEHDAVRVMAWRKAEGLLLYGEISPEDAERLRVAMELH
jgi:hypothetical protein